jgi:hypothetical protein
MLNDLVGYSRAGDVFHYRWAARRCLRLIYPNSALRTIVIEGSLEKEKAGEYVIDIAEYSEFSGRKEIEYFQLKHTTVQGTDTVSVPPTWAWILICRVPLICRPANSSKKFVFIIVKI